MFRLPDCILHVCGGDPRFVFTAQRAPTVFSTYVEVILTLIENSLIGLCILHVCGGDPDLKKLYCSLDEYSPRMWR